MAADRSFLAETGLLRIVGKVPARGRPLVLLVVAVALFAVLRAVGAPARSIGAVALAIWLFLLAAAGAYEAGRRADSRLVGVGLVAFVLGVGTVLMPTSEVVLGLAAVVAMLVPLFIAKRQPGDGPYL